MLSQYFNDYSYEDIYTEHTELYAFLVLAFLQICYLHAYCVGWGVKLYSLTYSRMSVIVNVMYLWLLLNFAIFFLHNLSTHCIFL